jgi:2-hydroxymuconate-semialdehyde hydrolase
MTQKTIELREEQFDFEGLPVTVYRGGHGTPLLLIHGSGPGASSLGNWRTVLPSLAARHDVYAMDLIGFGKSGRRATPPYFDFDMWVRQAEALLARIPGEKIGVIGHSISGAIALKLAASSKRVAAVMTTGSMGAHFEATDATRRCWRCPRTRAELILALKGLIHDASVIDEAYLAAREPVVFAPGYADYFDTMFAGDPAQYIRAATLSPDTLQRVTCPVVMLHGREDVAFPASSSIEISSALARADLVLLSNCSHSVAFERTDAFLSSAFTLFDEALGHSPSKEGTRS